MYMKKIITINIILLNTGLVGCKFSLNWPQINLSTKPNLILVKKCYSSNNICIIKSKQKRRKMLTKTKMLNMFINVPVIHVLVLSQNKKIKLLTKTITLYMYPEQNQNHKLAVQYNNAM